MRTPIIFLLLSAMILCFEALAGTHSFIAASDSGDDAPHCSFNGAIVEGDVERLKANVQLGCRLLFLNSPGGDVDAAIAMGRVIRAATLNVAVTQAGRCASACVFLYAGAVLRAPYGPVAIHRPYMTRTGLSFTETQQQFAKMTGRAKAYLQEVNVNPALVDMMMTIRPEQSEILSLEKMHELGMGLRDPVHSEYLDNENAARLGMTKEQYLARLSRTKRVCGEFGGAIVPNEEVAKRRACWEEQFPGYLSNRK